MYNSHSKYYIVGSTKNYQFVTNKENHSIWDRIILTGEQIYDNVSHLSIIRDEIRNFPEDIR